MKHYANYASETVSLNKLTNFFFVILIRKTINLILQRRHNIKCQACNSKSCTRVSLSWRNRYQASPKPRQILSKLNGVTSQTTATFRYS